MKNKKISFDISIKSILIVIFMILSVIGIVFGSMHIIKSLNRGASYEGSISTTVYFSPYQTKKDYKSKKQNEQNFDFTLKRNESNTEEIENIDEMLKNLSNIYASRLYTQGFNQVTIKENSKDTSAEDLKNKNLIHESWFLKDSNDNKSYLPSLTITVNKLNPQAAEENDYYEQQILRKTLFKVARNFDLSFETTDGVQIFTSDDIFLDTVNATRPNALSSDSSLTFELKFKDATTNDVINSKEDGAKTVIDEIIENETPDSDYFIGNGQKSVESGGDQLFNSGTVGNSGNRNVVLWNDKQSALMYVRRIFDIPEGSREFRSLTETERQFWNFLHAKNLYSPNGDNKNTSLRQAFKYSSDIKLKHLYYLYAVPNVFKPEATRENDNDVDSDNDDTDTDDDNDTDNDDNSSSSTISSPDQTRTSRGVSTDFSSLFSPYILYESRTTNSDNTQNETLTNIFPKDQQITSLNANAKIVLSKTLSDSGYKNLSFIEANRLKELLKNGSFANNCFIMWATNKTIKPIINPTLNPEQFDDSFTKSSYISSLIALAIFLVLIGVIISILYKIPGLLSFLSIVLGGILIPLLYLAFNGIIDLFTFLGIFAIVNIGVGCLILIFETFRRNIRNSTSILEAGRLAYKHTFMKIVDIHVLLLILGLFLMYLGKYQESSMGIMLIIGSFISFFVIYGSSTVYVKLFLSMNNWISYKNFVYKRDAKWLNEITGKIINDSSHFELNDVLVNFDVELNNLFKQNYRINFFSKKMLWLSLIWITLIITGIVSLILFSMGITWQLDPSIQNSSFNIFVCILSTMAIMILYLGLRYRWIVIVPYIVTSILNFFISISCLLIFSKLFVKPEVQFENILILFLSWIIGQIAMIFSISWNYNYWYNHVIYKKESLVNLINNNVNSSFRMFTVNSIIFPIGLLVISLFNIGGWYETTDSIGLPKPSFSSDYYNTFFYTFIWLGLLNSCLVNLIANTFFAQLLGCMMFIRQKVMKKSRTVISNKTIRKNYDAIDEQIIPGINEKISERLF